MQHLFSYTGAGALRTGFVAGLVATLTVSCTHGSEQLLLEQFFSASRLRDRAALERVSTVLFEPHEQGTVTTFTITNVTVLDSNSAAGVDKVGEGAAKQVTVSAPIRLPSGGTATKTIILVLERRDAGDRGHWVVTGFTVLNKPVT